MKNRNLPLLKGLLLLACGLGLFFQTNVARADVVKRPENLPPLLKQRFVLDGKFETGLSFGMEVASKFEQHYSPGLLFVYHFTEELAIGLLGRFDIAKDKDLKQAVLSKSTDITKELSNTTKFVFDGIGFFQYNPMYGKFNLGSELSFNYNLYIELGAGIVSTNKTVLGGDADGTTKSGTTPVYVWAVGFRYWIIDNLVVRLGLRDYLFSESVDGKGQMNDYMFGDFGVNFIF